MPHNKQVNIYDIISQNIKKYRKQQNITQKALAKKAGYSYSFIRRIEAPKCQKNFSIQTIYNISTALSINIVNLFIQNNIQYNMKLINKINNYLNEDDYKVIIKINQINIQNYSEILDFKSKQITVRNNHKIIVIDGKNLIITKMMDQELLITGEINNIRIN